MKQESKVPVFLNFYPGINSEDFDEMIKKNNSEGITEDGKFLIEINNKKHLFEIGAGPSPMTEGLYGTNVFIYEEKYFDENNFSSIKFKDNLSSDINGFIELLNEKYPQEISINSNGGLSTKKIIRGYDYFFKDLILNDSDNLNHIVYRDSIKTIVLSYTNLEKIKIPKIKDVRNKKTILDSNNFGPKTPEEIAKLTPEQAHENIKNIEKVHGNGVVLKSHDASNKRKKIKFEINITYFYSITFDSIFKESTNSLKVEKEQLRLLKKEKDLEVENKKRKILKNTRSI